MTRYTRLLHHVLHLAGTLLTLLVDVVRFLRLCITMEGALTCPWGPASHNRLRQCHCMCTAISFRITCGS
jgi:hypothetical protein